MPRQKQGQSSNQIPATTLDSTSPSSRFLPPQARVMSAAGQTAARSMQEVAASNSTGSWTTINGNLNKTTTRSSTPLSSVPSDPTPPGNANSRHTTTMSDSDPQQMAEEEDSILADGGHWADESAEHEPAERGSRGKTWTPEEHAVLLEVLQHLKSTLENGAKPVDWSDSRIYEWASEQLRARGYDRTRQACSNYWRRKGSLISGFHVSESTRKGHAEKGEVLKESKAKSLKRHSEGGTPGSSAKKRNRGPIKKLLPEEKEILVRQGHISLFPTKETERALAQELGWEPKRVGIWYSNTRRMGLHGFPITQAPTHGEAYQEDAFAAEHEDESAIMDDYADGDFADESAVKQKVSSASPAPYGTRSAEKRKANMRDHITPDSMVASNEQDDNYDVVSPPKRRTKRNSTPTSRNPVVSQAWAAVSAEPMPPLETRARAASNSKMHAPEATLVRTPLVSTPTPLAVRASPGKPAASAKPASGSQRPKTPTTTSSTTHVRPTSSRGSPKSQRKNAGDGSGDNLLSELERTRDDLENKKFILERNRTNYASSLADLEGLCVSYEQEIEDMQKKLLATRKQIADRQKDGSANEGELQQVSGGLEDIYEFIQKRKARLGL